jgi:hypothetical protein
VADSQRSTPLPDAETASRKDIEALQSFRCNRSTEIGIRALIAALRYVAAPDIGGKKSIQQ